jgi:4-hydroxy-tetrahydrodipicolinate synthase
MVDRDEARHALTGPIASLHPVFDLAGELDPDGIARSIDHVLAAGTRMILLTYGDSLHSILTDAEVGRLLRIVAGHVQGRALVVAADRAWATAQEAAFAREAREIGADALLVLAPTWGGSATADGLVSHYRTVAAAIPIMVVTAAFAGAEALGLEVLERLATVEPRLVGVKDDLTGEFARRVAGILRDRVGFFSGGQKQNHLDLVPYGCDGYMSTFIHFNPSVTAAYWDAIARADLAAAADIVARYDRPFFDRAMTSPGGFDAVVHAARELAGVCPRWRRPPYHDLDGGELEELRAFLVGAAMLPAAVA